MTQHRFRVWWAIYSRCIVGPYFLEQSKYSIVVTAHRYLNMLKKKIVLSGTMQKENFLQYCVVSSRCCNCTHSSTRYAQHTEKIFKILKIFKKFKLALAHKFA